MKEATRGIIEKAIDSLEIKVGEFEEFQKTTPIKSMEEFLLGYTLGYLRRNCEVIIHMHEGNMTSTDEETIRRIIVVRIPEVREKLKRYLNR